jgi:hypothetical protein
MRRTNVVGVIILQADVMTLGCCHVPDTRSPDLGPEPTPASHNVILQASDVDDAGRLSSSLLLTED